jgi:hypothetical protein
VATVIGSATVDLGSLQAMVEESRMMTLCLNSKDSNSSRGADWCLLLNNEEGKQESVYARV